MMRIMMMILRTLSLPQLSHHHRNHNVWQCYQYIRILFIMTYLTVGYHEMVVNFLRRPDVFEIIPRRFHHPITPDLRALIETIQMTGTSAMEELASRPRMLDLAIILR